MDAIIDGMTVTDKLTITILADNSASSPYRAEHGFSALVDLDSRGIGNTGAKGSSRPILFDVGVGALFDNVASAGVDLSRVGDVVLSHGHYDHTDALPEFLSLVPGVNVHASADFFRPHYSLRTGSPRSIGLSAENRSVLAALSPGRFSPFRGEKTIAGGQIILSDKIPRVEPLETPSPLLFADEACSIPDAVPDELFFLADTAKGLVILTGCCHAGFINTCERARALSGDRPIYAVVGGFHLANVGEERMAATADYIVACDIPHVIACHCTGDAEIDWLKARLGTVVTKGECGMAFSFCTS
jgi:7,8-dihydropterin-6-yl-methyl-4-(beta-D-ribofuranosyl)aminobenzene 5'-phosphate synthase